MTVKKLHFVCIQYTFFECFFCWRFFLYFCEKLPEQMIDECYTMLEQKYLRCIFTKTEQISYYGDGDKLARAFENIKKCD